MGLLDNVLSTIDAKKRTLKRGLMDMLDNPSQWAGMQANRIQEDRYGGAENAQAMKQYLTKQPYDPKALTAANDALRNAAINESLGAVTAWHGSPHKFDKFDMSKIGTGEGAQAYGHGLYMAESPDVAKSYADELGNLEILHNGKVVGVFDKDPAANAAHQIRATGGDIDKAIKRAQSIYSGSWRDSVVNEINNLGPGKVSERVNGSIYKVDIPDEAVAKFLDWDKPLSQQAPEVQAAMKKVTDSQHGSGTWDNWIQNSPDYREFRNDLMENFDESSISSLLHGQGIPGIRYLDGGSRGAGAGTSNYVLFDDKLPRILETNGKPTGLQPWAKGEWEGLLGK